MDYLEDFSPKFSLERASFLREESAGSYYKKEPKLAKKTSRSFRLRTQSFREMNENAGSVIQGWIHKKRRLGWSNRYFVLFNDLSLIYYSSGEQRNSLALHSRGRFMSLSKWSKEGTYDVNDYTCHIPEQNGKYFRLHLHHVKDTRLNVYLSFKTYSTRDKWIYKINDVKCRASSGSLVTSEAPLHESPIVLPEGMDDVFIGMENLTQILSSLPMYYQLYCLQPAFATHVDGISFQSLYNETMGMPTLLIINSAKAVFGVFIPKIQKRFCGAQPDLRFFLINDGKVEIAQLDEMETVSIVCDNTILGLTTGNKVFTLGENMNYGCLKGFGFSKELTEFRCQALTAFILSDDEPKLKTQHKSRGGGRFYSTPPGGTFLPF